MWWISAFGFFYWWLWLYSSKNICQPCCLHSIAGSVSDRSSHRERSCTGVMSVQWMSQHYTKRIKLKYCEKKNNNCSLFQSSKLRKKNIFHSCLESRCMHWLLIFIYLILLYLKTLYNKLNYSDRSVSTKLSYLCNLKRR